MIGELTQGLVALANYQGISGVIDFDDKGDVKQLPNLYMINEKMAPVLFSDAARAELQVIEQKNGGGRASGRRSGAARGRRRAAEPPPPSRAATAASWPPSRPYRNRDPHVAHRLEPRPLPQPAPHPHRPAS